MNIIYSIEIQKFNRGDVLFRKGDQGNHFYIVLAGSIDIFFSNPELKIINGEIYDLNRQMASLIEETKSL